MRALATLILGLAMLYLGREYLNTQFDHVKAEIAKPADVPEMKPAYDTEKLRDFDSTIAIGKPVNLNGGGSSSSYSPPAPGSEPTTDLSSYQN